MKINYSYEQHKLKWWHAPFLVMLIVGTYFAMKGRMVSSEGVDNISGPWEKKNMQRCEGLIFGTVYHITYQYPEDLSYSIKQTMLLVDNSLSPFNPKSTITAINENVSMEADSMFSEVFNLAKEVSQRTYGAFDITVAPLVNLWGFGFKNLPNVTDGDVDSLRRFVGFDMVSLDGGKVHKSDSRIMLDCSAIAKGYAVDVVGRMLESKGICSYMVEIGGEVRLRGCNPSGHAWNIGINRPVDDSLSLESDIERIIRITNTSMATSGNYRNFYIKDGKKYAHTIDPRTGYPTQQNVLSATVLHSQCSVADAYATSFMVLGLDSAKMILSSDSTLAAFFIYSTNKGTAYWCSPKLEKMMTKPF